MAFPIVTTEGAIPSWGAAGMYNTLLAALTKQSAVLTAQAPAQDVTDLAANNRAMLPGLGQWSVALEGLVFSTPRMGNVGLAALSAGTLVHIRRWSLTLSTEPVDITAFNSGSPPQWRRFRPNINAWSGSISTIHDSSTMPISPALATASATATSLPTLTLTYGLDATANTLAGSAILNQTAVNQRGQEVIVDYDFEGTGALTAAGTNSLFSAGAIGNFLWDETGSTTNTLLTLTAYTAKTYTGSAFLQSLTINCEVGGPVSISAQIQGTDALTFPT